MWRGLLLCALVSGVSSVMQELQVLWFGRPWLDSLVIAILLGMIVRSYWIPSAGFRRGIDFSAKILLEFAIVLLGASMSASMLTQVGGSLLLGTIGFVIIAIVSGYAIGRIFGLSCRVSTLVACGNAICGNSAIMVIAPVIDAHPDDVASSIAFTAILGVIVVVTIPMLAFYAGLNPQTTGIFAGLTVYAVPQVIAATAPVGIVATQLGTFVKLMRVLLLGPVVIVLSLLYQSERSLTKRKFSLPGLGKLVPWFIVGFILMVVMRSMDWIPLSMVGLMSKVSSYLAIMAMAALGLGVKMRSLFQVGLRMILVVTLCLLGLCALAWQLIKWVDVSKIIF